MQVTTLEAMDTGINELRTSIARHRAVGNIDEASDLEDECEDLVVKWENKKWWGVQVLDLGEWNSIVIPEKIMT